MAPVHEAAKRNDVEALRTMLDAEPGLIEAEEDQQPGFHSRPLHYASEAGHMEVAELLLDRGAFVNAKNLPGESRSMTPLMYACEAGSPEMVALLLSRGADPSLCNRLRWTALAHACFRDKVAEARYVAIIRLLIQDGRVPVDMRCTRGRTALWHACNIGHVERARVLLLEGGADHTIRAEYWKEGHCWQWTAKSAASDRGHGDCVHLLEWYEGELEKPFLLSKARAVVDATESISRAPEKVGAKTRAQAQKAREEAAPAYLRSRVMKEEALPLVEVVGQGRGDDEGDEEGRAVGQFVVRDLKEDLLVELMEGLMYRRWVPEESRT